MFEVETTTTNIYKNMKYKLTLLAVFAFTASSALSEHKSIQGSSLSAHVIFANMYNLENEVIKIDFPGNNAMVISKDQFSLNYGSDNHIAVVLIPAEVAKRYFSPSGKRNLPKNLFVKVTIGEVVNEFGAKSIGPILLGVGTKTKRGMGGVAEHLW
jgi:hypothetical protein